MILTTGLSLKCRSLLIMTTILFACLEKRMLQSLGKHSGQVIKLLSLFSVLGMCTVQCTCIAIAS